jgi:hypothetical protein
LSVSLNGNIFVLAQLFEIQFCCFVEYSIQHWQASLVCVCCVCVCVVLFCFSSYSRSFHCIIASTFDSDVAKIHYTWWFVILSVFSEFCLYLCIEYLTVMFALFWFCLSYIYWNT